MSLVTKISSLTDPTRRRLVYATAAILLMIVFGSVGFQFIEDLTWRESIYLATATVTTVGYGDIVPKTPQGQIFTAFFMLVGVGTVLYALSVLAQTFIQTEILAALGINRRTKETGNLENHYIVCGVGRVGKRIVKALQKEGNPFVIIENNETRTARLELEKNEFVLIGDATLEKNLLAAGVKRAKGLIACLPDDALNVHRVLSARNINRNLHIVSRAVEEQAEPKLIQAGANRFVSPLIIGSTSISRALLKPAIADFMGSIVAKHLDLVFEGVLIGKN